ITTGVYNRPGFGILPKALVWGFLGLGIKMAFTIFAVGAPAALAELGLPVTAATLKSGDFFPRLLTAFFVSVTMNSIFAPLFMTLHKITDLHIAETGGTLRGFLAPIPMGRLLKEIRWDVMWGFVFKWTLPCFWVPAHTLTFMLPPHFQVVFAALLGVVLGVILAMASMKKSGE
ncbi:MAG: Mpv17/PMP22 family protein, partial [Deltaproteobacteria bacterium]|nr:Mpv17/PMP22 family protein [Deltaproteobacteria bacterium]